MVVEGRFASSSPLLLSLLLILVIFNNNGGGGIGFVSGADKIWIAGTTSNDWHNAVNWSPAVVPNSNDNVTLSGQGVNVVTLYQPTTTNTFQGINVGSSASEHTTLYLWLLSKIDTVSIYENSTIYQDSGLSYWTVVNSTNVRGQLYIYDSAYNSTINVEPTGTLYLGMGNVAYTDTIQSNGQIYVYNSSQCNIWRITANHLSVNLSKAIINYDPNRPNTPSQFTGYITVLKSTFQMFNNVNINNTFANFVDSKIIGNSNRLQLSNSTLFSNDTFLFQTGIDFDSGILSLRDGSKLYLSDTPINSDSTSIYIMEGSVLEADGVFSDINLAYGYIYLQDSRFTFVDHVWVSISKGTLFTLGSSVIRAATNTVLNIDGIQGSCFATGNTEISIEDDSSAFLIGHVIVTENSTISAQQDSFIYIKGILGMTNNTNLSTYSGSQVLVEEGYLLMDNSQCNLYDSYLSVSGSLMALNNSHVTLTYTNVEVPGTMSISSRLTTSASNITVMGDIFSDGIVDAQDNSWLLCTGELYSLNYTRLNNSLIASYQKMQFGGEFIGINAAVGVVAGDLVINPSTNFTCTGCGILVQGGSFTYSKDSNVVLIETSLETQSGASLISDSDIFTFPGSTIQNAGTFTLSRNIHIPTTSHPLYQHYHQLKSQSLGNVTLPLELANTGTLQSTSDILIEVPLKNQGILQVSATNINVTKYTQTGGSLNVGGGSVSSNNSLDINGGSIQGNGHINGNIEQSGGSIGSRSQSSDKLNINGNLTQTSGSTIIVVIQSPDDYSQFNISNNANFSGTIEIRVAKNLTNQEQPLEIPVISYSQTQGDFSNIKVITYDPENGEEDEEPNCNVSSQKGGSKYSVLVSECQSASMSKSMVGVIVGIVVAIVVGAVIAGVSFHYRKRIAMHMRYRKERASLSLDHIRKSIRDN